MSETVSVWLKIISIIHSYKYGYIYSIKKTQFLYWTIGQLFWKHIIKTWDQLIYRRVL